jgi:hypothetical protein
MAVTAMSLASRTGGQLCNWAYVSVLAQSNRQLIMDGVKQMVRLPAVLA